jgi:hypothetical protein
MFCTATLATTLLFGFGGMVVGLDNFQQGLEALARQDWDLAIACFRSAFRENPGNVQALELLGDAYQGKGDFGQASYFYGMVIRRELGIASAYNSRGLASTRLGILVVPAADGAKSEGSLQVNNYEPAIADFSEAIRLNPLHAPYYVNRSIAYLRNGQVDSAVAGCDAAARLDPLYTPAYAVRALAQARLGDFERAQADARQAIRMAPNHTAGYAVLAWIQATSPDDKVRNGKQAVDNARRAYQLSLLRERDPVLLATVAAALAENGQFDEAVRWQRRALRALAGYGSDYLDLANQQLKLYQDQKPFREE